MRLLDLFCGAGGAAVGYHQAGFDDIVGVDIDPQPNYPFTFIQADALQPPIELNDFDLIHASPPCQAYSPHLRHRTKKTDKLIEPTRTMLEASGVPFVIENVKGAPLTGIMLCGSSFGARLWRHRYFETRPFMLGEPCRHDLVPFPLNPWNTASKRRDGISGVTDPLFKEAMGIDWMTGDELREAIPPFFTKYIGERIMDGLGT